MPSVLAINSTTFTKLFQDNQQRFILFAYSYIKDKDEAEDIVMESMYALWESRDKWDGDANIKAILLTIIKNKALNYLSRQQTRLRIEDELTDFKQRELNLRISTLEACNPDLLFDTEIQEIVKNTLEKLPTQSKNIFVLSRYKNESNKIIAEQLGISVKSVEFHITKVLKELRLELRDYLISFFL